MIGAGGAEGQNDAANLLKPALARGELRTIAATTWAEYKKYFEKDAALARRFQVVKVEEPGFEDAVKMMRGLCAMLEAHHGVRILDEAVIDSVRLSNRYIPARQLPDKSMSVLDTACARVAIGQHAIPAPIEDLRLRLEGLDREEGVLVREMAIGADHDERLAEPARRARGGEDASSRRSRRAGSRRRRWSREIHDAAREARGRRRRRATSRRRRSRTRRARALRAELDAQARRAARAAGRDAARADRRRRRRRSPR